ncbi:uncharacterized protein NECHADRAFT_89312 [Fusarium vanettenii 77-13-4]|uniref:Uncharacterized protein n=1 Tax=Fusarium vanettenii (strain ATCC MYA-4622 / CBS 123669 / FGSC 9596 / NRRL 45880 / 77-13-4) TaxID=660122 RepID=C7ZQU0_FUSV7|nr:uncharacterized protein NECHADRAFT_89312 [Fusarium vanettenii 77-13-4]EEU33609.1 hypothetical protein NECHADRAFT_89312 [Fusarium vanettenii 77-13-4]
MHFTSNLKKYALFWEEGDRFCRFILDHSTKAQFGVILRGSRWTRIDWLLEAGADVHAHGRSGRSCFSLAFSIDDDKLKKSIIAYADLDVLDGILVTKAEGTPILLQWLRDCPESTLSNLGLLVRSGANPNATNSLGQTCLHLCIQYAHPQMDGYLRRAMVELIQCGADVYAKDHIGRSLTELAFYCSGSEGLLGTYPADLWSCSLVACGYDVFGNIQGRQPRLPRFGTLYKKIHFRTLWEEVNDGSYLLTNIAALPKEQFSNTFLEITEILPVADLRRLFDFRPSLFHGTTRYQWVADLQEIEMDSESIWNLIGKQQYSLEQILSNSEQHAPSKDASEDDDTARFPVPEFHHESCCHQRSLVKRPPEPEAWTESVEPPDLSLVAWHMERLADYCINAATADQRLELSSDILSNRLIDGLEAKSVGVEITTSFSAIPCLQEAWEKMMNLAVEWQLAGFCCDRISMMLQKSPSRVDLETISFDYLQGVYNELEDTDISSEEMQFSIPEDGSQIPYIVALYRKVFHDLLGVEPLDQEFLVPSNKERTLHHLWLLTQAISIAMLLYWQCHTGYFHSQHLPRPVSVIVLGGYVAFDGFEPSEVSASDGDNSHFPHKMDAKGKLKIIARLQDLTCAGKALGKPVFVFTTQRDRLEPAMLYGSCEDIVDTFGESSIISTDPDDRLNTMVGLRVRGRTIFPTQGEVSGEQLFHWGDLTAEFEPSTFNYTDKILIGAPFANDNCKLEEENARHAARAAGCLEPVDVLRPFWYEDQLQVAVQGGQSVILTAGVLWKYNPGRSLKESILKSYARSNSLNFLNDLFGLQFSVCTGLARRVPLRQLMVESPLFDMLDHIGIGGWDVVKHHVRGLFKDGISLEKLKDQDRFPRGTLHEACRILLEHLRPTGVGLDGQLRILWPTPEEPGYCFVADLEKHPHLQWCQMIRDNEWCATFAAMTATCIETEGHRCPSRDATVPWRFEKSLLSTEMFQPSTGGTVLKVGASYWIGDAGSGVWVTAREPEQGSPVLVLNRPLPPSLPKFAWRFLKWDALRECRMNETFSTNVVVYARKMSPRKSSSK